MSSAQEAQVGNNSHPNGHQAYKSDRQQSVTDSKADLVSMELESNLHKKTAMTSFWGRRTLLEKLLAGAVAMLVAALIIILAITITKTLDDIQSTDKVCNSADCISAAHSLIQNMDFDIDPCDNFYLYACGGYEKRVRIPDDENSRSQFAMINDDLEAQLRDILESEESETESLVLKQARYYYQACMNVDLMEELGIQPLKDLLNVFGGWPVLEDNWDESTFNWDQISYRFRRHGFSTDYLFDFSIGPDLKNSTARIIYFDQANLGVSREYLIKGLENEQVRHYYTFMQKVAVFLGADPQRAADEMKEALMFEMVLANISMPREERRNVTELYNLMTLNELGKLAPLVNWTTYVNQLLTEDIDVKVTDDERVVIASPKYFSNLTTILAREPKRTLANFMLWRAARSSIDSLTREARDIAEEYSRNITGRKEGAPRWKGCVSEAAGSFSAAVGKMYVTKHFNEDAKDYMLEMVSDIKASFNNILDEISWMDGKTKRRAKDKLKTIKEYIAYPDEILSDSNLEELYKGLHVNSSHYFHSGINMSLWSTNYHWKKLRESVNKTDWKRHASPAVVNAFYTPLENSIQFPAGILQGVFYGKNRPNYLNYGGIGWVIGHEITHGFDDQGRQYDHDGNLKNWWEPETMKRFIEKTECIVHQYSNYSVPSINVSLNGINTQGENIADNGGIKEAYRAYESWMSKHGKEQVLPGLSLNQRQLFWLGAANVWCFKYRPKILEMRILTGVHSPGMFRVLGSLSNSHEFSRDFNCPVGSKMNPVSKCEVW